MKLLTSSLVSASSFIILLGLVFSIPVWSQVEVITRWVLPLGNPRRIELQPMERSRPIILGDILYIATAKGDVLAVHRVHDYVIWQKNIGAPIDGAFSYARSKLIVGDTQGNLYALNARDGSEVWRFKISSEWLSAPVIFRDKVFAASSNDDLYAITESHGKEVWHYSQRGDEKMTIRGTASPTVFGDQVFQGFADGHLVALEESSGRLLWKRRLRSRERFYDVDMAAAVDEKHVVIGTFDGNLYSLERATGNTVWILKIGSHGGFLIEDDRIYFSGLNGNFLSVSKDRGEVIWRRPYSGGVGMTPTRVGDYLVFTTSGDPVYLLNPKDGKMEATLSLGAGAMTAAVTHPEGQFFCLSNYGNLFSFEIIPRVVSKAVLDVLPIPSARHRWIATTPVP